VGCGGDDAGDAMTISDGPVDAFELPLVTGVCESGDSDNGAVPVSAKTPACAPPIMIDASDALFSDAGDPGADAIALHALCARMNPVLATRDDLADSQLAADLHAYLVMLVDRPPLQRALSALPTDAETRANALATIWLPANGFEHVLCGELNGDDTVGGLHQWSEYYLAEREARGDFLCTQGGATDQSVDMLAYRWKAPGASTFAIKPLGSFFVGASPACTLALGYAAHAVGIPSASGDTANVRAALYGATRDWVLAYQNDAIVTLYPHAQ
jgi:hypothetical protein